VPQIHCKYRKIDSADWLDLGQTPDSILLRHNPITPEFEYQYKWYDHTDKDDEASVLTFRRMAGNETLSPDQFAAQHGFPGHPEVARLPVAASSPVAIPAPPAAPAAPAAPKKAFKMPVEQELSGIYILFVILIIGGYLGMLYLHKH
jgi:hypothetical protein